MSKSTRKVGTCQSKSDLAFSDIVRVYEFHLITYIHKSCIHDIVNRRKTLYTLLQGTPPLFNRVLNSLTPINPFTAESR